MGTVPLPPWLRAWQQTWYYQALLVPFVVGFGGFLVADGCLSGGIFAITLACAKSAFSGYLVSLATVFISGKSVGSPDFKTDGTANKTVENIVTIQKAAPADAHAAETWNSIANTAGAVADKINNAPPPPTPTK
jgi:hypothetical protein